nr:MAG TPA: protein of unknown function (DUF4376) [Caudoviricetes sp.]
MTIYYKDNAFYNDDLGAVPAGAVEISDRQHAELLAALNAGCLILPDLSVTPPRPSALHTWDAAKKTWVLDKAAVQAHKAAQQEEMWTRIKQKRHDNLRGGVYVKSIGKWLHSDDESRAQYTFMRTMPTLPEKMVWKTMDNTFVPMTKALLDELSLQLLADEQADFANAERHRAAMLKADNPLDYDYSGGWTANYATEEAREGTK